METVSSPPTTTTATTAPSETTPSQLDPSAVSEEAKSTPPSRVPPVSKAARAEALVAAIAGFGSRRPTFTRAELNAELDALAERYRGNRNPIAADRDWRVTAKAALASLIALGVVTPTTNADELQWNESQASVVENIDHQTHLLYLLKSRADELLKEEQALIAQLNGRSSSPSHASPVPAASAGPSRKRKLSSVTASVTSTPATATPVAPLVPVDNSIVRLVPDSWVLPSPVELRALHEISIRNVRVVQTALAKIGGRSALERLFPSTALSVAEGPTGATQTAAPVALDAPCSSSITARRTGGHHHHDMDPINGHKIGTNKHLLGPSYEIELSTLPIEFSEIASQFETWTGGASGGLPYESPTHRSGSTSASPRRSSSAQSFGESSPSPPPVSPLPVQPSSSSSRRIPWPTTDSAAMLSPANSLSPRSETFSPPPPSTSPTPFLTRPPTQVHVPSWSQVDPVLPRPLGDPEDAVARAALDAMSDEVMLSKHDTALESFRKQFEAEQALKRMKRRESTGSVSEQVSSHKTSNRKVAAV